MLELILAIGFGSLVIAYGVLSQRYYRARGAKLGDPPGNVDAQFGEIHQVEMGDHVRIRTTPDTVAAGYANRTGTCLGFTTPSLTGVQVIGQDTEDYALSVDVDDGKPAWFARSLVEFLDVSAGMVIGIGNKRFVRAANGDWVEDPDSRQPG
jgi:hypothetical protein